MSGNNTQTNSLIEIDVDDEIRRIIEQLDGLTNKVGAAKILKAALDTATARMRKDMIEGVLERYTFKKKSALNKESKVKKASGANLQAAVVVKGSMREIKEFKFRRNGKNSAASGQVLKSSGLKLLAKDRLKAFVATFHNSDSDESKNHVTIVRRVPGEEYSEEGKRKRWNKYGPKIDITKIMPIYSPSVPHMIGSQEVQQKAQENAYEVLQAEIQRHIARVLEQGGR